MASRPAAVTVIAVGWSAAVLNQFRSASLIQADALVLLPQGGAALVVLAVVGAVAVAVVLSAPVRKRALRWLPAVAPQRLLLVLAALVSGYLATSPFAAMGENDFASKAGLPLSLMLPTASRSLVTAAVILLLAGLAPWRAARAVLLALGGLALLTLSTPTGATDWLAPFPLSLLVAALIVELHRAGDRRTASDGSRSVGRNLAVDR